MELLIIFGLSLLMVPVVALTSGILRIALGLAFVLFFPGYIFVAVLFPRKKDLDGIERLVLSFGLSILIVPLIGLALYFTCGIHLYPLLITLLIFIAITAAFGWYRRQQLPPEQRFEPHFSSLQSWLSRNFKSQNLWDKILIVLLVLVAIGAIGMLGHAIYQPKEEAKFSEFYILNQDGTADSYPSKILLGEEIQVILGFVNHENETTIYRVQITIGGDVVSSVDPITINDKQKLEQEVTFIPVRAGLNQKVEFLLYINVDSEPYRTTYFWLDVMERE